VLLTAAAAVLAACQGGPAGPTPRPADGTLSVWALNDPAVQPALQGSLARFNATSPKVKARLQVFGNDPYKQKLPLAMGASQGPDVFFNWGGGSLRDLARAGKVRDITERVQFSNELQEAFFPNVLAAAEIDGKNYGLPMRGVQPLVLYYNKQVLAAAGVTPPRTWDELLTTVDRLKAHGVVPIALAGSQAWTELMWAEYLLDRIGGYSVFDQIANGDQAAWRDSSVLEAMTRIQQLVDRGAFGPGFASVRYDAGGASTLLAQGRAGMHLMGSWEYGNLLQSEPAFVRSGDLGWVTFPAVPGGLGPAADVVGNPANFYSIAQDAPNGDAAEDFIALQLNSPQYVDALIKAGDVPAVTGIEDRLARSPNSKHALFVYGLVRDAPNFALSWDQALPPAQAQVLLSSLQKVFLKQLTPQQFADTMANA
jgi:raffinose/stachyose/melibiose transport system substrate-binding protein/xylobiose transport system substrate-binding protein